MNENYSNKILFPIGSTYKYFSILIKLQKLHYAMSVGCPITILPSGKIKITDKPWVRVDKSSGTLYCSLKITNFSKLRYLPIKSKLS